MSGFITKLGSMSIQASLIIVIVLCVRVLFDKLHIEKKYTCLLWVIPYISMICPWKPSSVFSFWNAVKIPEDQIAQIQGNLPPVQNINPVLPLFTEIPQNMLQNGTAVTEMEIQGTGSMVDIYAILFGVWLIGVLVVASGLVFSYIRLKSKLITSVLFAGNIYWAEEIPTPFVFGIVKPKIYFPVEMKEEDITYILEHERTHVRRLDHLKKPAALFITAIHWFNPFAWLACKFFAKDMELACDEETIQRVGQENSKEYAKILLNIAVGKRNPFMSSLAFGESDIKSRIKNIMQKKKAWKIVTIVALVFIGILGITFLTDHKKDETIEPMSSEVQKQEELEQAVMKDEEKLSPSQLAKEWAEAFCSRDGEKIENLASKEVIDQMLERDLLMGEKDHISFVKSSLWPSSENSYSYSIQKIANSYTEILYYAFHGEEDYVVVWLETIHYDMMADKLEVIGETLEYMENIDHYDDFIRAYPKYSRGVVANTYMDYLLNGRGEVLNYKAVTEPEKYRALLQPESAAIELLNLSKDLEAIVRTEAENGVIVRISLKGNEVDIPMIQPYGKDGIWIVRGDGSVFGDELYVAEGDGHRQGYKDAVLHAYDAYDEQNPERKEIAQRALRELYDLTGTLIEECWYRVSAYGVEFGQTKDDIEHSRIFYSRDYSDGNEQMIQNIWIVSRRRIWYSPVDMYTTPEFEMLSDAEKVVWYVTHSASYNGKKVKEVIQPYDFEVSAWHVIMEDDTAYEVYFDTGANIIHDITGPYPNSNIQH